MIWLMKQHRILISHKMNIFKVLHKLHSVRASSIEDRKQLSINKKKEANLKAKQKKDDRLFFVILKGMMQREI